MTLVLPDVPMGQPLSAEELRLELACALCARGQVGKVAGAELAGVDFFAFQRALAERGHPAYTETTLAEDLETLDQLPAP
jgi:predicted HTH domain antitoxin